MKGPLAFLALLLACGGEGDPQGTMPAQGQEDLIKSNRDAMRLEDRDIALYLERNGLATKKSGTGVHLLMLRDVPGEPIQPEQLAVVRYRLELLNGEEVHVTDPAHPEAFRVEHDAVESGLHEGIQSLSPGDSALIIIPSYRAHGIVGDMDRIPPRSTLVYHLGLVRVVP